VVRFPTVKNRLARPQARSFSVVLSDPKGLQRQLRLKTFSDTVSVMAPAVQKPGAWGKRQTGDASAGSIARLKDWGIRWN